MNFKVDFGPWETIFQGTFYGHEVEVVMNPEKYILTIIYEKRDNQKIGALVDGHKALVARGNIDAFIQTLPKKCIGITKTNGDRTSKMIFISFNPIYLDFKQEDYVRKLDNEIKKSFENIDTIIELAKSSSLQLKETNLAPETEYTQILGDPFMARSLLSGLKKTAMELMDFSESAYKPKSSLKIQLGLTKNREIVKEENENLYRTIIIGNKNSTNYTSYILTENFLLESESAIIFDSENYFEGLGSASNNAKELKEEMIDYEPAGFPIKKFKAKETIKIPLKYVELNLLFDMIKLADKEINTTIKNTETYTIEEYLKRIPELKELNDFKKLKLERVMKIIQKEYAGLFGMNNDSEEIIKKWPGSLGRATIINTSNLSENEKTIFTIGLMKNIEEEVRKKNEKGIIIVLPNSNQILQKGGKIIIEQIINLQNLGIGFIISTEKELKEIQETNTAKINIVNGKDIAVSIKNKRNYRLNLRPSLSGEVKI